MSKYKVGDKVILTVSDVNEKGYCPYYRFNNNHLTLWKTETDEYTEPLSIYTESLEAEITRLLAENERLKDEYEKMYATIEDYESHENQGAEAAWELARKIVLYGEDAYSGRELKEIFDCTQTQEIIRSHTYPEAASKVAEWKKAKEKIKIGDVLKNIYDISVKCTVTNLYTNNRAYLVFDDGTAGMHKLDNYEKTGRHIDIDGFLKQIRGEEK